VIIGTAAIRRDHQLVHVRITLTAHRIQPAPDRIDSELGCIVADSKTDATSVGGDVVNPIRRDLAKILGNWPGQAMWLKQL